MLTSAKGTSGGASNYGCGFLPTMYGGVPFRSAGDPVLYLSNPQGIDDARRSAPRSTPCSRLNELARSRAVGDPEIAARIQSYEMAYRLQTSAPELMDLVAGAEARRSTCTASRTSSEAELRPQLPARPPAGRARRPLRAALPRSVGPARQPDDRASRRTARDTDQASAALVTDLKERGLLDDTIVIWGGEFGRTPMVQGGNDGRDHHNRCFTHLAGRRRRASRAYVTARPTTSASTSSRDPVHVHDLHATILHLLGFDHTRLTYRFQGRDLPPDRRARERREGHPGVGERGSSASLPSPSGERAGVRGCPPDESRVR